MRPAVILFALAIPVAGCARPSHDAPSPAASAPRAALPPAPPKETAMIDHEVETLTGAKTPLASLRGKVLLIVNTASECGYTPQYAGLERLHETYAARGFTVLGFPCNDFGGQEPGTSEQIQAFCSSKFHVTFPLFAKVKAKGPAKSPLYATLTESTPEGIRGDIKWNFTKFLVDKHGRVVARFEPKVDPLDAELTRAIEAQLALP